MFQESIFTKEEKVVYSILDRELQKVNNAEAMADYLQHRNPDVLTIPTEATTFVIKPLTPYDFYSLQEAIRPDPRVFKINKKLNDCIQEVIGEKKIEEMTEDESYEIYDLQGQILDSLSDKDRQMYLSAKHRARLSPVYWCRLGVTKIISNGKELTWSDFEQRISIEAFLPVCTELADLIREMSEASDLLGK